MSEHANTIACVITFGSRWRPRMRGVESPPARAASTHSRRFALTTSARMIRV